MNTKSNITFETIDYILIAISAFLLISTWCYVIISYDYLPETIAVHFDAAGQPNGYNDKSSIWLAPIIFTLLIIGFIFESKYPQEITFPHKELSLQEKKATSKTMLFSCNLLSSIVLLISFSMIETSLDRGFSTKWILPIILLITTAFLIGVFFYQKKIKK